MIPSDIYPLTAQQFNLRDIPLNATPILRLTNDYAVSKKYPLFKKVIERVNKTFKSSYSATVKASPIVFELDHFNSVI